MFIVLISPPTQNKVYLISSYLYFLGRTEAFYTQYDCDLKAGESIRYLDFCVSFFKFIFDIMK